MFNQSKHITLPDQFTAPDSKAKVEELAKRYVMKNDDNPAEILEMLGLSSD